MTELYRHVGADTDVPAGDIGVGVDVVAGEVRVAADGGIQRDVVSCHEGVVGDRRVDHSLFFFRECCGVCHVRGGKRE